MWTQDKPFDPAKGGTKVGWCLRNSRMGYEIAPLYGSAYEAWQHTVQHKDKNFPVGMTVPVFWKYIYEGKQSGHVGAALADGRVWTDGRYYANVDELNAKYLHGNGTYLGWGETLNDVRVVSNKGDEMLDETGAAYLHRGLLGEEISEHTKKYRIGKMSMAQAEAEIKASDKYKKYVEQVQKSRSVPINNLTADFRKVFGG